MAPVTVSVVNRKGGCSKTSTCFHLAGAYATMGKRVLLVDLDPQANLTQGFLGPTVAEALPINRTVLTVFRDDMNTRPEQALTPTAFEGVTLLAGASALEDYNRTQPTKAGSLQRALRDFLADVKSQYDVTLLDCPPNLQLCTWNALIASDFVLVPLQPEDFGGQGITSIQRFVDQALQSENSRLRLLGYLITQKKRRSLHTAYEKQLRSLYGPLVVENVFADRKDYAEAVSARKPVSFYKPGSDASQEMSAIAQELLNRVPEALSRPVQFLHIENRMNARTTPILEVA